MLWRLSRKRVKKAKAFFSLRFPQRKSYIHNIRKAKYNSALAEYSFNCLAEKRRKEAMLNLSIASFLIYYSEKTFYQRNTFYHKKIACQGVFEKKLQKFLVFLKN